MGSNLRLPEAEVLGPTGGCHLPETMSTQWSRRTFLGATSLAAAGAAVGAKPAPRSETRRPVLLGGSKAYPESPPLWPVTTATDERAMQEVLRSRSWFRGNGKQVLRFEEAYAALMGARCCVATSSGTAALTAALGGLDLGPGDEVILPPYTFVATYNVVVLNHALPVFVDTDAESFQIDATQVESAITPDTRAILPVHIAGSPADLDRLLDIGRRRQVPIIEDACQAHLAEWRGRKVGTWGLAGCFSFQASKNLTSGEGGAVVTDDETFAEACYRFHTQGRGRRFTKAGPELSGARGTNLRLTEFQAALLVSQMTRLEEQSRRRQENAAYLTSLLREIRGIRPAKLYEGTTRSAWHLYMFAYDAAEFSGMNRSRFLEALGREGVPASGGYTPLPREPYVAALANQRHYLRIYGEARMKRWLDQTREFGQNDRVCASAVWLTQNLLLGSRGDMDRIADAIRKIQRHSGELAKG